MHNGFLNLFFILILLVLLPIAKTKDIIMDNVPDRVLRDDIHLEKRNGSDNKIIQLLEALDFHGNESVAAVTDVCVPNETLVSSAVPNFIVNDNVDDMSVCVKNASLYSSKISKLKIFTLPWSKKPKRNIVKQKILFNTTLSLPNYVKNT